MGIAAYNRGSAALSQQFDRDLGRLNFAEIVERLNQVPKRLGVPKPFQAGVIRLASDGIWWIMNNEQKGWASSGRCYGTLPLLMSEWDIQITGYGNDSESFFYRFE